MSETAREYDGQHGQETEPMSETFATADPYSYWRNALNGVVGDISADHPQLGRYRMRKGKDGPYQPVAIFSKDGEMQAAVGREFVDPLDIWTWCADKPVSEADYKHAIATGSWPGDAPPIGDNSKNYATGFDGLKAELEDYGQMCREFLATVGKAGGIKTKADADRASNMADAIGDVKGGIARKIDEAREEAVAPHLKAQRDINAAYKPLVDEGKSIAADLRRASAIWTKAEQDRLQKIADEAAAKARAEAEAKAKAEREAWEREQVRKRAIAPDEPAIVAPPPAVATPAIVAEKVKVSVGGQRGARRSLKTEKIAKITDHAKALAFFAEAQEVKDAVAKLAQRAVDAKMPTPPGVEVVEEVRL